MKELFLLEVREGLAGGKVTVAFLLMVVAFLVSLGMMNQEYERRLQNHSYSQALSGEELFFKVHWFFEFPDGNYANWKSFTLPLGRVKHPDPLMFVTRGLDTQLRQAVDLLGGFPIIDKRTQPNQDRNVLDLLYPAPDLLFFLKVLVSLLAMIFAFDLVCGERAQGTLKLILSNGVSRVSFFFGKYLGGLFSMTVAFSAAFLIYILVLTAAVPLQLSGEAPARVGLIYIAGMLGIAVFYSIAAAISTFTRSRGPALVLVLFFWLLLVFVLPGIASLAAKQMAPVDSEERIARMKYEVATSMERQFREENPEAPMTFYLSTYGPMHDQIRPQIVAELDKIEDEHQRMRDLQMALATNLARSSPAGSLSHVMAALCRTGLEDYFLMQEDYQEAIRGMELMFTEAMRDRDFMARLNPRGWELDEDVMDKVNEFFGYQTAFPFRQTGLEETWGRIWLDLLLLALFAALAVGVAFVRMMVYDVR